MSMLIQMCQICILHTLLALLHEQVLVGRCIWILAAAGVLNGMRE